MSSIRSLRLISIVVLLSLTGLSFAQTTLGGYRHDGPGRVAPSTSTFSVGVSRDNGATFVSTATVGETVLIRGEIRPEAANVGQPADIFVVARLLDNNTFLMRTSSGAWVSWNGTVSQLQPFRRNEVLDAVEPLDLFTGTLATAGDHRLFLGYMSADGILRYHVSGLPLNITRWASASEIVGDWRFLLQLPGAVLSIKADGTYVFDHPGDGGCSAGVETGTYDYSPATGVFKPIAKTDANGDCAFSHEDGVLRLKKSSNGISIVGATIEQSADLVRQ